MSSQRPRAHARPTEGGRLTAKYGGFLIQPPLATAVSQLARAQHCVFTLDQLFGLGMSERAVHAQATTGRLHRIYRGVYALIPPELLSREGRFLAAVFACGPGAALSHRTAAALHGLRATAQAKIDVTVRSRSRRHHPGLTIHRSTTLTRTDVTTVNNIPVTTIARTFVDLAEVVSRRAVERTFDQAEIEEALDLRAIEGQLRRNRTRRGAAVVRTVLDEHYIGRTPTWSELEEAFLSLCRAAGLPEPEVNQWLVLPDDGPPIRADFMWRRRRVVVETDGFRTHRTRQAFERDRRLDQRLTLARWRPVRLTWRQIKDERGRTSAMLEALLKL